MSRLPRGTVTLLFTDIQGSTELLRTLGRERYVDALGIHRTVLRDAFTRRGGVEVEMQGDSFFYAFPYARDAVAAAAEAQRRLAERDWPDEPVLVRMGIHTGEPMVTEDDLYAGLDVHRAARVMSVASGGQILLSERTTDLVDGELPDELSTHPLGAFALKDFDRPEALAQVSIDGLPGEFPPPRAERAPEHTVDGSGSAKSTGGLRSRRALIVLLLGVIAVVGGLAVGVLLTRHSSSGPTDNAVVEIDPTTDSVVDRVAVGNSPTQIAAGSGGVWVVNADDGTVSEVDPSGKVVRTFGTSGTPTDVAVAGGAVWIADRPNIVLRVDPASGDTTNTLTLRTPQTVFASWMWLATSPGLVWVSAERTLSRIPVRTLKVRTTPLQPPDWGPITVGLGAVWESFNSTIYRFDRTARRVAGSLTFPQGPILAADGFLWALNASVNVAAQIDAQTDTIIRTVAVGNSPSGIASGAGSIWVSSEDGTVTRIDPQTGAVQATIHVGGSPQDIAVGYGRIWIAVT